MSRRALVAPLVLALAACASAPEPVGPNRAPGTAPTSYATAPAPVPYTLGPAPMTPAPRLAPATPSPAPVPTRTSPSAAGWAVSIIGTPFALAFKTVVCAASVAIAAPVAGFLTLGVDPSGEGYQVLGDGIAQNCGPPYVVSPYAGS
jgi:hypothetical protein